MPACTRHDEYGCVVAFSAFQGIPPADALFGQPVAWSRGPAAAAGASRLQALCTNPAALGGGEEVLNPYLPTPTLLPNPDADQGVVLPGLLSENLPAATTGFVSYPDYLTATCDQFGGSAWLDVTAHPAGDGDVRVLPSMVSPPSWGLHFTEFYLVLGDLVTLVDRQSAAYFADHPSASTSRAS
jgi:hypothetical protein